MNEHENSTCVLPAPSPRYPHPTPPPLCPLLLSFAAGNPGACSCSLLIRDATPRLNHELQRTTHLIIRNINNLTRLHMIFRHSQQSVDCASGEHGMSIVVFGVPLTDSIIVECPTAGSADGDECRGGTGRGSSGPFRAGGGGGGRRARRRRHRGLVSRRPAGHRWVSVTYAAALGGVWLPSSINPPDVFLIAGAGMYWQLALQSPRFFTLRACAVCGGGMHAGSEQRKLSRLGAAGAAALMKAAAQESFEEKWRNRMHIHLLRLTSRDCCLSIHKPRSNSIHCLRLFR